ncbi:MAG TPA: sterol desaturase family protein [Burkholderiaceae bacterium]|jgi:sterol desaturase/sphingolipid hydroxylase (fatty acid hydroxylase superfamily)
MTSTAFQNSLIVCAILGFALMEFVSRRYKQTVSANGNDAKLELLMFISLLAISQPLAFLGATKLCNWLIPDLHGALKGLSGWAWLAIILVADDMTQYWWHRASHSPLMWPLHRAHHSAKYMSIRITYRNNFFYYLMMPGLWMAGALTYLGVNPWGYAVYFVVKITVILGAHCAWRWDEPLYRVKALQPLMWVLERTISTPATHAAHHAITNLDGIGHYKGNYGNLLFIWDMLFGTAKITRQFPKSVGLMDDVMFGEEHWTHQMFYPFIQSKREHTALKFGGVAYEDPPQDEPAVA